MEVKTRLVDNIIVYTVKGEIDMYEASSLHETYLKETAKHRNASVVIDMEQASYIDSSGIGVLFQMYSDSKTRKTLFCLCNVGGMIEKLFKLSRMISVFPIEPDMASALRRAGGTL